MKYQAKPVIVDAFQITKIFNGDGTNDGLVLGLQDGSKVIPDEGMLARMTPKLGDYVVTQADGYVYLNPKDVFERKYGPVEAKSA